MTPAPRSTDGGRQGQRRTLVKVCGITNLEDARTAVEAGADWIGFILLGESPRRIEADAVRDVLDALQRVEGVGVMVAPSPDEALALARRAGVARVQLHGVDASRWPRDFPLPVLFAARVSTEGVVQGPLPPGGAPVLLDTAVEGMAGGTGRSFHWPAVRALARERAVVLAGGLGPENVRRALDAARPFGVDASSRLERAPGLKDPERVRAFVQAVRQWDRDVHPEESP